MQSGGGDGHILGGPRWTADAVSALLLHGYLRSAFSREADADGVTWRDAVRLRSVSKAFRTIVDTLAFWRAQYDQLTADKRYDPPHLVALEERGAYREAFRLGLREMQRTNIRAPELQHITFFSKAMASAAPADVLAQHCPWWGYDQPRQHRFRGDGTLDALTHDPTDTSGKRIRATVGYWTYAFVPAAPEDSFIVVVPVGTNRHLLWRVQRHETWCIVLVGADALKVSHKIPLRDQQECQEDELQVDEAAVMNAEDQAMLHAAGRAMDQAAGAPSVSSDAPTAVRLPELDKYPHAKVALIDEAEWAGGGYEPE
jgi:hypothetical protein